MNIITLILVGLPEKFSHMDDPKLTHPSFALRFLKTFHHCETKVWLRKALKNLRTSMIKESIKKRAYDKCFTYLYTVKITQLKILNFFSLQKYMYICIFQLQALFLETFSNVRLIMLYIFGKLCSRGGLIVSDILWQ